MSSSSSPFPGSAPDVELMLRVQRGDEAAFGELMEKHRKRVLNLVFRYVGEANAAEDIAQDVFVRVYQSRHRYTPTAKFSTWLYRIAVNHCLNAIRARKSQAASLSKEEGRREGEGGEAPDEGIRRSEVRVAVREAIDSLPPSQRMAVLLARFEELSYQEIGEAMGLSLEAVKSLLFRAKESLQERLRPFVR